MLTRDDRKLFYFRSIEIYIFFLFTLKEYLKNNLIKSWPVRLCYNP